MSDDERAPGAGVSGPPAVPTAPTGAAAPTGADTSGSLPAPSAARSRARWWFAGADLLVGAALAGAARLVFRGWPPHPSFWLLAPCAALMLAAGSTLLASERRARLPALAASWACLAAALPLIVTLLVSAGYLRSVYGALGPALAGTALVMVVLAADVLVLVPVLQLRWLGAGRPLGQRTWVVAGTVFLLALAVAAITVARLPHLSEGAPEADQARKLALALRGAPGMVPPGEGAVRVAAYSEGLPVATFEGRGSFAELVSKAASALPGNVATLPLRVDVAGPDAPLPATPSWLVPVLVREAMDGLVVRAASGTAAGPAAVAGAPGGDAEARMWPDDLATKGLNQKYAPLQGLERYGRQVAFGVDVPAVRERLAGQLGGAGGEARRFAAGSVVSYPGRAPVRLETSRPAGPAPTRAAARAALEASVTYLAQRQRPRGTFDYVVEYANDFTLPRGRTRYSLGRHSTVAWFLTDACTAGVAAACPVAERARRAIPRDLCGDLPCVSWAGDDIGSFPLAQLALLGSGADGSLVPFVRAAQRPDGNFWHGYDLATKRFISPSLDLYADGQAALGLLRHGERERAARAVEFGMNHSLGPATRAFFLGEHSLCMAAAALPPELSRRSHAIFCRDYARFYARFQHRPGDPVPSSYVGGYGLGPVVPPQVTTTATRTHGVIAALQLCRRHGLDCEDLRQQMVDAIAFLLRAQLRPDDSFRLKHPDAVIGAFPDRDGSTLVRSDIVAYAGLALIGALDLLPG